MLPSLLCTIAAGGCAVAASFIGNRVHQLVVVVVAVLFWFTVWCLLIEPMYIVFALFAAWLVLIATIGSSLNPINRWIMGLPIFRKSTIPQPDQRAFHPNCRSHIVPSPFAPYRPISPPLTQEDIDRGNHP